MYTRLLLRVPRHNFSTTSYASSSTSGLSAWKAESVKEHTARVVLANDATLEFRTGHIARFASGSAVLTQNDNAFLATVVSKFRESENGTAAIGLPFYDLQLSVDFRQSAAAVGRIPTNYFRREMQVSDQDIVTSRIIDRSVRPSFYQKYPAPTHIVCKPLAIDETGDSAVLGVNVASAALAVSDVPTRCTVGAARVGIIDGKIVINPSIEQLKHSTMDMVISGSGDGMKVFMIEMDGQEISSDVFCESVHLALIEISRVTAAIKRLANSVNHPKQNFEEGDMEANLLEKCDKFSRERLTSILMDYTHDKQSRDVAVANVRKEFVKKYCEDSELSEAWKGQAASYLNAYFSHYFKKLVKSLTLTNEIRCDGRKFGDFRPINVEVDVYKKLHGSAMFQRGQSQVFATVTFDSPQAAFHPDSIAQLLGAQQQKTFMLHYEFPQFAVGELAMGQGGANRREVGHGLLAEKALKHVIPDDFPYTIRLAAQVLESNGSTSMASACAGSMALLDAGVNLKGIVAGAAIGLFTLDENEKDTEIDTKDHAFLTDLMGMEDYFGDMDFKMAGTSKGFTAMQLDLKVCGISERQVRSALRSGRKGIDHVLAKMSLAIDSPRPSFKDSVPIMETWNLPPHMRRAILFRHGAYNAKLIQAETGVQISAEEETAISLMAPNKQKLEKAKAMIEELLSEKNELNLTFGAYYKLEITEVVEYGVMGIIQKGSRPILVHNSQLSNKKVGHASALGYKVGDQITVRYYGRDAEGYHRFSRKALANPDIAVQNQLR